jgi:DNA-binding response OmpR family regulator
MATILVVDDSATIRLMLRTILEAAGYEVIQAADGNQALRMYNEQGPDLIIIDLVMPGKEGIGTISELRGKGARVKIIAMSGGDGGSPEALPIAGFHGADVMLAKPFDITGVLKAVQLLLAQRGE